MNTPPTADSEVFFAGARSGVMLVEGCAACGHLQFPPREYCLRCASTAVHWVEVSGAGTLLTFTTLYRAPSPTDEARVPYTIGVIRLDAGPQLMATIVGDASLVLDQRVSLVANDRPVPAFAPCGTDASVPPPSAAAGRDDGEAATTPSGSP